MPYYRFADFTVFLEPLYPLLTDFCCEYEIPPVESTDFVLSSTAEEIAAVRRSFHKDTHSDAYIERLLTYDKFCKQLPERQAMFLHAAVIAYEGRGYAFIAESGTGKSTHISLWKRAFGEKVTIINGDKPVLRLLDGVFYAYGTPWSGKEGWQENRRVPLAGLCFLERGAENQILPLEKEKALSSLLPAVLTPTGARDGLSLLSLFDALLRHVPAYRLICNMDIEAAYTAEKLLTQDALRKEANQNEDQK